jgi:Fic family protein
VLLTDRLTQKKKRLDRVRPLPPALVRNLEDWFRVELTYTSNALEGNTLTRRETAVVIEKGLTIGGKSLNEHIEATNHARALDCVHSLSGKQPNTLRLRDVLELHEIVLSGIDTANAGRFRNVPNPRKISDLMDAFEIWMRKGGPDMHPVVFAGEAHYRLVTIHPFMDGNGRTARLLMNLLLLMRGYPPALIRKRDTVRYLTALETAQLGGSKADFELLIQQASERSLDIYLSAAEGKAVRGDIDQTRLLKIGQLAKAVGETTATLRFWTQAGLLALAETTAAGYGLYDPDAIAICRSIQQLKQERLTLAEIKERLREAVSVRL